MKPTLTCPSGASNVVPLPTASGGRVRQRRGRRPANLSTVADARQRRDDAKRPHHIIEIGLLPDGRIMYDVPDLAPTEAIQALLGCYAVMGEMLDTLRHELLPSN